jgi:hypothetical protein
MCCGGQRRCSWGVWFGGLGEQCEGSSTVGSGVRRRSEDALVGDLCSLELDGALYVLDVLGMIVCISMAEYVDWYEPRWYTCWNNACLCVCLKV